MGQSHNSPLLAALTAECVALQSFADLLEHEQNLLLENHTDPLLELAKQKSAFVISLNKLAEIRRRLLQKDIPVLSVEAIQAWLEAHSSQGLAIWEKIRGLAEVAQQLNRTNGKLIQMKLRHNQQSLAVLSNAVNKADLYGPDGQPSLLPGSGRSLGSG